MNNIKKSVLIHYCCRYSYSNVENLFQICKTILYSESIALHQNKFNLSDKKKKSLNQYKCNNSIIQRDGLKYDL